MPVDRAEFDELVEDVREHGLPHPVVLHEGRILDGQRRVRLAVWGARWRWRRRHDRAATSRSALLEACGIIISVATGEPLGAVLCDVDGVVRHWDREATAALEREYGLSTGTISATAFAPDLLASAVTGRSVDPLPPAAELDDHPAAALFPLLPVDSPEFGELVDDIG